MKVVRWCRKNYLDIIMFGCFSFALTNIVFSISRNKKEISRLEDKVKYLEGKI